MPEFMKYQALGNDYLLLDPGRVDIDLTPDTIRLLCDRHFGIGADGVLHGPIGPVEPGRPIDLRIFNPDGGECERSGNGIRMFAHYLSENYLQADEFTIRTLAGPAPVEVIDRVTGQIAVGMGLPSFDAAQVPVEGLTGQALSWELALGEQRLTVTSLNIGNPHTVVPVPALDAAVAHELGPRIARHPRFPEGTNVQFLEVLDRSTIRIEIWERGAGYTLASGSSSCAAAAAARALGLVDDRVRVLMPGGHLDIGFGPDGEIRMTGPAEPVAAGDFAPEFRRHLQVRSELAVGTR